MTENERIKYLRTVLLPEREGRKISQSEFCDGLGIKKAGFSQLENGKHKLTPAVCILICKKYGVNEGWLKTGEGEPFKKTSLEDDLKVIADEVMSDAPDSLRRRIVHALARMTPEQWNYLDGVCNMILGSILKEKEDTLPADEAAYIKSVLGNASNTDSTASSSTDDTEKAG